MVEGPPKTQLPTTTSTANEAVAATEEESKEELYYMYGTVEQVRDDVLSRLEGI